MPGEVFLDGGDAMIAKGRTRVFHRTPALGVAASLVLSLASCGGLHDDLCERAAACGGGGDLEIEACVAELDRRDELATIYGCSDGWDDYTACLDERGYCDEDGDLSGCDELERSYHDCVERSERGKAKVSAEEMPAG